MFFLCRGGFIFWYRRLYFPLIISILFFFFLSVWPSLELPYTVKGQQFFYHLFKGWRRRKEFILFSQASVQKALILNRTWTRFASSAFPTANRTYLSFQIQTYWFICFPINVHLRTSHLIAWGTIIFVTRRSISRKRACPS